MFLLSILPYDFFPLFIPLSNPCLNTEFSLINTKDYPRFFGQCWAIAKVFILGFLHFTSTLHLLPHILQIFPWLEAGGFNAWLWV